MEADNRPCGTAGRQREGNRRVRRGDGGLQGKKTRNHTRRSMEVTLT